MASQTPDVEPTCKAPENFEVVYNKQCDLFNRQNQLMVKQNPDALLHNPAPGRLSGVSTWGLSYFILARPDSLARCSSWGNPLRSIENISNVKELITKRFPI